MKKFFSTILTMSISVFVFAQSVHVMTPDETNPIPGFLQNKSFTQHTTPPTVPVRCPGQFEEMQGVFISWEAYSSGSSGQFPILAQIVDYAQEVGIVYIATNDSNSTKSYLTNYGVPLTNVKCMDAATNTIWARDFGPNNIYENEVENLSLVDWKYNRTNRDQDDAQPLNLAQYMNIPVYRTTVTPNKLVHTGGNWMCDGHGTAFSSKLVLDENASGGGWSQNLSEANVDSIEKHFMGITRYIKMETLPYDGIHHIDMHMKLLDEETLLMAQYPTGVSDGPQIELNLDYVTSNFMDCYGRPYKIIRMPQPPQSNGNYPGGSWGNGDYLTYTNALILNNIVLVPSYYTQYDTTALRIWQESMPGYHIHMINCNNIIGYSGAIHCITHEIGVADPIFISHAHLLDTYETVNPYEVKAYIKTTSGVNTAKVYWSIDTALGYQMTSMTLVSNDTFVANIPAQVAGTKIWYYITANSISGRTVSKPLVAPAGVYEFRVLGNVGIASIENNTKFFEPYPNPASESVTLGYFLPANQSFEIKLFDINGREIFNLDEKNIQAGTHSLELSISSLASGIYTVSFHSGNYFMNKKVVKM